MDSSTKDLDDVTSSISRLKDDHKKFMESLTSYADRLHTMANNYERKQAENHRQANLKIKKIIEEIAQHRQTHGQSFDQNCAGLIACYEKNKDLLSSIDTRK